ncbi:MAG: DUF1993 family protein [Pseudomonadales bacterium]|nr:DUF1993 family protein [Pseudomonadales bacterium]
MPVASEPAGVVAVVLAAGLSRRMGASNKLLLPVAGQAMVRHVVQAALASRCGKVLVVIGHEAGNVRQALSGLPVEFVLNQDYREGIGSSVRAGASAVSDRQAVIFCLADMPGVTAGVIDQLVDALHGNPGVMGCQASYQGKRGNPVLWASECLPQLRDCGGDEGARPLLRQYREQVIALETCSEWVMVDLDTPEDYRRVYNRPTSRSRPQTVETFMTISLYAASIPVFKQMLNALSGVLTKAEAHATAKNIDPSVFLQARLAPDMFPLVRQVQIAVDFAKGVSARLAEIELPKYDDSEVTFADLQALISKVLAFVDGIKPEQIDGKEGIEIITRQGTPKEKRFTGQAYLLTYGLPQFFFHVTTAYAILRHNGVEVGKRDYMGAF